MEFPRDQPPSNIPHLLGGMLVAVSLAFMSVKRDVKIIQNRAYWLPCHPLFDAGYMVLQVLKPISIFWTAAMIGDGWKPSSGLSGRITALPPPNWSDDHIFIPTLWLARISETAHSGFLLRQLYYVAITSFGDFNSLSKIDWSLAVCYEYHIDARMSHWRIPS